MEIKKKPLFNELGDIEVSKKKLINGNTTNLNDFNNMKYKWASDWYRQAMNNFWIPEEINLSQDLKDYGNLDENERVAYDKILSFLIFLDSIQTANLSNINNYITASEINLCLTIQAFQEAVHSQSYSYMLDTICSPEKRNEILYQWKDDKELREVINQESVNEELFQNYKLNVFDIAYLTEEQIKMFQSDFGIIADYFVKRRKGYKTIENHKPIKHVDEMLKFMRIFAEDERFLQLDVKKNEEGEVTMCTILDTAINKGIEQGISQGISQGITQGIAQGKIIGENATLQLVKILLANNKIQDIDKIYNDIQYRNKLMEEYKIYERI